VSFDGLSCSFLWLGSIGISPLEFPGRSAVVDLNSVGLVGTFVLLAALLWAAPVQGQVILTSDEIAQTLAHGPWPQAVPGDPSNRFSGAPKAIALGKALFSDPVLSADGTMSCATCHDPARGFSDGLPRHAVRGALLDRNTSALWNMAYARWFGWAGDTDSLWAQSMTPITSLAEMGHSLQSLAEALQDSAHLDAYQDLAGPVGDPETVWVNLGKILAAYQETLVSGQTPFDRFRDALEAGDLEGAGAFPQSAQRGLRLFLGKGNCTFCHSGPLFTNGEFHDAGMPYFITETRVDEGRFAGLQVLLSSPYTLAGDWSDDPEKSGAWAVQNVRQLHSDFGTFKVPGLRNVAQTAPYMHDGGLADLRAVVGHYNTIDLERLHSEGEAILTPLGLDDEQLEDLVAFLRSLSDDNDRP